MKSRSKKKKVQKYPGIIIECKSGRFVAYYEHRTDIIANGISQREVKKNLKEMYESVMAYEEEEENAKKPALELPKDFKARPFKEKLAVA